MTAKKKKPRVSAATLKETIEDLRSDLLHATCEANRYLKLWNESQANFEGSEQKLTILSDYIDKQKADHDKQVTEMHVRIRELYGRLHELEQSLANRAANEPFTVDVYAGSVQ